MTTMTVIQINVPYPMLLHRTDFAGKNQIHTEIYFICSDTAHHNVFGKVPLSVWLEALGKYLAEVHLHDNHGEADEHLPVGEGTFDFKQFFSLLSERKLSPIYTLEPHEEEHLWRGMEAVKQYVK